MYRLIIATNLGVGNVDYMGQILIFSFRKAFRNLWSFSI